MSAGRYSLDRLIGIGLAFRHAFASGEWIRTYLLLAAVLLIPVAGFMALLGWQRRAFELIRAGSRRPPVIELGADISLGAPILIEILLLALAAALASGVIFLPLSVLQTLPDFHSFDEPAPQMTVMVVLFIYVNLYPEIMRRALVGNERWIIFKPQPSINAIRRTPLAFALTALGCAAAMAAGVMGYLGLVVGLLFSLPVGHAVAAHILVPWSREAR